MDTEKKIVIIVLILFNSFISVSALGFKGRSSSGSSSTLSTVSAGAVEEYKTLLGAVGSDNEQMVLSFLAKNQGVINNVDEEKNDMGQTALMVAAINGNAKMVEILLLHGANLWLRDNNHKTAISLAQSGGASVEQKNQVVAILMEAAKPKIYKEKDFFVQHNNNRSNTKEVDVAEEGSVLQEVLDAIASP